MKKYLLLLLLTFGFLGFSQEKISKCNFEYDLKIINNEDNMVNPKEAFVVLDWDFSKIDLNKSKIKIEITPIFDCFNELEATNLSKSIIFDINSNEFNQKDNKNIKHLDLKAKCFKYRVLINSKDCEEVSNWKYYSYF